MRSMTGYGNGTASNDMGMIENVLRLPLVPT